MANLKGETVDDPTPRRGPGRALRLALAALPLACLAAYAAGIPFPLPAFLLPERAYAGVSVDEALADSYARMAAARPGRLAIPRIGLPGRPSALEIEAARAFYRSVGLPVRLEPGPGKPGPLAAYAVTCPGDGSSATIAALVDEAGRGGPAALLAAASRDTEASPETAPQASRMATLARTERLPRDARLAAVLPDSDRLGPLSLHLEAGGRASDFSVMPPRVDDRRILLVTKRPERRSVLEALRPVRKVGYGELATAGVYGYELVALDGPVLSELDGAGAALLAGYVRRGAGSLLLAVDSPDFGKAGDAPALEEILPVEPAPRALSRLPDVAMVVAIDVSGSMYGDKLSLAKAVGLELVANLKDSDLAGILLFDEEHSWLSPLAPVAELDAAKGLAPLSAGGGTALAPALEACIAALEGSSRPERRVVVVSDGISAPADFDALTARAFRSGIVVSSMAVGAEFDRALLTRIASGSGGRFYRVSDASDVPSLIVADRRELSRALFAEERVDILDLAGSPSGRVDGMARLGLRPESMALFSSVLGDPLLASRRVGSRATIVYASDLYGRYGEDFLARPGTLSVLDAVLSGLLTESPPALTITETADGLSASIRGDFLVEPSVLLADPAGRTAYEGLLGAVAPGRFFVDLGRRPEGPYALIVSDRGRAVTRAAVYSNGGTAASPSDSAIAALDYRSPSWAFLRGGGAWLVAFFVASLGTTLGRRLGL